MSNQWFFPVHYALVESPEFKGFSTRERLAYLDLVYEFNKHRLLQGVDFHPLARTDSWWAERLRISKKTFANACSKFIGLKWVSCNRGFKLPGQPGVASRYNDVRFSNSGKGSGDYAGLLRVFWAKLILALQRDRVEHIDLVTFALAGYLWRTCGGRSHGVALVTKPTIVAWMPVTTFKASLANLLQVLPALLSFEEKYRHFRFLNWTGNWKGDKPKDKQ
jgi:hypothetical protein